VSLDAPVRSASLLTETVRDNFEVRAYTNNDGTQSWAGPWTEINDDNEADGGKVKIDKSQLKLEDKNKGLQRSVDLSLAQTAVLSFDYRRDKLDKPAKFVVLEISTDDGVTWSELYRFADGKDSDLLPLSLDITPYIAANTTLRFLTSPDDAGKLYVDNFQIEYTYEDTAGGYGDDGTGDDGGDPGDSGSMGEVYTVRDEFSTGDFTGSHGLDPWAGIWSEEDPAGAAQDPADGYIQMVSGELRINNQNYDNTQPRVTRAVDLSRTTSATLTFDYRTAYGVDISDGIAVEVSPDNGETWILLDTIENLAGITSGSKSYDISPFANAYTLVRIGVAYFYGLSNEYFYVDNLEIAYTYDGEIPMRANLQTVADDFNAYPYTYSNNSGSLNWLNDWQEVNDDGQPLSGDAHFTNYEGGRRYTFWTDAGVPWQPTRGLYRSADLSGAAWAEVSFLYSRGSMDVGDFLYVEASTDGGATWTEVGHVEGKGTQAIAGSDKGWMYAGFDLSNFISANTAIRLITNFYQNDYYDNIYIDDVTVSFDKPTGATQPNYYLETLNVQPVWDLGYDGAGVTVAVVDSGVALDYDFSSALGEADTGRLLLQIGFNQYSDTVHDAYGHGTHVAGIIAGNGNGSSGFYQGIAPGANLIGLKVSDEYGMAYESDTVAALQWISDHKDEYNIRVVNMSINSTLEASYHDSPLDAAVEILWLNGIVVVASSGNKGPDNGFEPVMAAPANDPMIITVGASEEKGDADRANDVIAPFTSYEETVDFYVKPEIIAPGKDIISTLPGSSEWRNEQPDRFVEGGYFRISGTSMAAPMVAGAAALLLQAEPTLTPDQVKYRLTATAGRVGKGNYLDVYAAITTPTTEAANQEVVPHMLLAKMAMLAYWASQNGEENIDWANVNWDSVNWDSVNWDSVNWDSVNWNAVNWNAVNWNAVNWNAVNWNAVNWNAVNWNAVNWNSVNWNSVNWNSVNWNSVNWTD
jgi:serine protease AprX